MVFFVNMQINSVIKIKVHIFHKSHFGIFDKCGSSYFPEDTMCIMLKGSRWAQWQVGDKRQRREAANATFSKGEKKKG